MPTIGISIPVPDPFGAELQRFRVSLGDESARQIPTHITLAPPTELDSDSVGSVTDHLSQVASRHEPFEVHLRGTGTFRPVSAVVFVSLAGGISSCEQLAAGVRGGPVVVASKFPYHPHVTIAQDLDGALLDRAFAEYAGYEQRFWVPEFSLYIHDDDAGWQPVATFPLGP